MNVQPAMMDVPYGQASTMYYAYRRALREQRATRDDKALLAALRKLLKGAKVIDINLAIGLGGRDTWGRPKIAIARADWPFAFLHGNHDPSGEGFAFSFWPAAWQSGRRPAGIVTVPESSFGPRPNGMRGPVQLERGLRAQVPSIPPQFRPLEARLGEHHILFEAVWGTEPTRDPMLLKHVDGPFFVVLAAWDLTPLEQAVLRAKL